MCCLKEVISRRGVKATGIGAERGHSALFFPHIGDVLVSCGLRLLSEEHGEQQDDEEEEDTPAGDQTHDDFFVVAWAGELTLSLPIFSDDSIQ